MHISYRYRRCRYTFLMMRFSSRVCIAYVSTHTHTYTRMAVNLNLLAIVNYAVAPDLYPFIYYTEPVWNSSSSISNSRHLFVFCSRKRYRDTCISNLVLRKRKKKREKKYCNLLYLRPVQVRFNLLIHYECNMDIASASLITRRINFYVDIQWVRRAFYLFFIDVFMWPLCSVHG